MKYLAFLVIVAVAQGFVLDTKVSNNIPRPTLTRLMLVTPPGFEVEWTPVQNLGNPILGYKVKVWEVLGRTVYKQKEVNGELVWVPVYEPPSISDMKAPKGELTEVDVKGAGTTKTLVSGLKAGGTIYEVRVSAYTRNAEGEDSIDFMRVQINDAPQDQSKDATV